MFPVRENRVCSIKIVSCAACYAKGYPLGITTLGGSNLTIILDQVSMETARVKEGKIPVSFNSGLANRYYG